MYPIQYCIIMNLDAGLIYKRLLNHRPVIQNEVHYFVKEFEVSHSHSTVHEQFMYIKTSKEMNSSISSVVVFTVVHA